MKKIKITLKTKKSEIEITMMAKSTCSAIRKVAKVYWEHEILSIKAKILEPVT